MTWKLNLSNADHAYFFGFIQTDGHLASNTRNRGKLTIELSLEDKEILEKFQSIIPYYSSIRDRTRNTNFKENYTSSVFSVFNLEFRKELILNGLTCGKKSDNLKIPDILSEDYFRGIIDGDGSLGFTEKGFPFLSLATASENLALAFSKYLELTIHKNKKLCRNKRDEMFNITIYKEDAQRVANELYYDNCLSLTRKFTLSREILNWVRPIGMRKSPKRGWDDEQDKIILTNSVLEASKMLNRTVSSIKTRLWRLNLKHEL